MLPLLLAAQQYLREACSNSRTSYAWRGGFIWRQAHNAGSESAHACLQKPEGFQIQEGLS
jgi:hypothetical protein